MILVTKTELLTNQKCAQIGRESKKFVSWLLAMIFLSMIIGVPYLTGMLIWVLAQGIPLKSCGVILGEIAICIFTGIVIWAYFRCLMMKTREMYRKLGLQCPRCGKYAARTADIELKTGRCWNCNIELFDSDR